MREASRSPARTSAARGLRTALIGGGICALGLVASLGAIGLMSWFWIVALIVCLGYAWFFARGPQGSQVALVADAPGPSAPAAPEVNQAAGPTAAAGATVDGAIDEARVFSAAGHDMRQPLQAISLFSATLATHPLPHESAKLVKGIERAAEALSALFEAVMALVRLNAGRIQLQRQDVALGSVLQRCVAERMEVAQEKGIHLRHVPTALFLWADEAQLAHALDCLIVHALATSERGGGIVVGCRRKAAGVQIEVWDNGPAVPAENLGQLFEPFSVYGQGLTDRGLGLVLARRLLRAMGGELTAGRTERRGKRLVMQLPH